MVIDNDDGDDISLPSIGVLATKGKKVNHFRTDTQKKRGPFQFGTSLSHIKTAATYSPTLAVPSARSGLTSLFGMGRGGTPTL